MAMQAPSKATFGQLYRRMGVAKADRKPGALMAAAKKKSQPKLKHMKPKGKKGMAQVKRLGRTFKTGGFNKIAKASGKKYGSTAGKRIAGAVFNRMAAKH